MTEVKIIYCDEDVCVCDKPRGFLSEGEGDRCVPDVLSRTFVERGEGSDVFVVHRLDRETEGLTVYARSSRSAASLSAQIADGRMEKEYIAELCGAPEAEQGTLRDMLFYDRKRGKSYVVDRQRRGVREGVLEYRVIERLGSYTRVRVKLLTGRTHQIRVQFASRGMPLRADRRYGAPAESGRELALRACYLKFVHPRSDKIMEFGDK